MPDRQTLREPGRWRRFRTTAWPGVVALVAVVGTAGFLNLEPAQPGRPLPDGLPMAFHEAVYNMLRLYTVDVELPPGAVAPWYLWFAAFVAPLVVVRAIAGLFPGAISTQVVRFLKPSVLVFGANSRSDALLRTLPTRVSRWRKPVVVVDSDRAALATISAPRVWKAMGDGAGEPALRRTIKNAADIVLLTGDDARNSTVTSAVLATGTKGVLFAEVEQPGLARALEQGGQRVDVEITTFSAAGLAAEAVLDELGGVDWESLRPGDDPDTPPAVALFGTGVLVDAVVLELHHRRRVQLLEDRGKTRVRPRILLVGPDATEREEALATLMGPELQVLDLDPLDVELDQVVELTPDTARQLARHSRLMRVMVLAPTDLDGGGITITLARHLGRTQEVVLVVEGAESPSGDEIERQAEQSETLARVRCFRAPDLAYRLPVLQAQRMGRRLARALYEVDHREGPSWRAATLDVRRNYDDKAEQTTAKRLSPPSSAVSRSAVVPPALTRTAIVSLDLPEDAPLRALGFDSSVALARAGLHVDFHRLDALVAAGRALVTTRKSEAFGVWGEVARLREAYPALRDDLRPVANDASREIERLVLLRRAILGCPDARRALRVSELTRREPTDHAAPVVVLAGKDDDEDATARRLRPTLAQLPVVPSMWATASTRALLGGPPTLRGPDGDADRRWESLLLWSALLAAGHDPTDVRVVALPGASADDLIVARSLRAKVGRVVTPHDDDLRDILLNGSAGIVSLPDDPATVRAFLRPTCWPAPYEDEREPLARELHGRYVERQRARKPAGDPALRPWAQLSPWLQRSNRAVVDDIPAKLAHLGLELAPRERSGLDLQAVFDEHLDELAELEHGRFTAERVLTGWTTGMRNPTRFVTPYLMSWTELSDEIKDYDREVVGDMPELLARHGLGARPIG